MKYFGYVLGILFLSLYVLGDAKAIKGETPFKDGNYDDVRKEFQTPSGYFSNVQKFTSDHVQEALCLIVATDPREPIGQESGLAPIIQALIQESRLSEGPTAALVSPTNTKAIALLEGVMNAPDPLAILARGLLLIRKALAKADVTIPPQAISLLEQAASKDNFSHAFYWMSRFLRHTSLDPVKLTVVEYLEKATGPITVKDTAYIGTNFVEQCRHKEALLRLRAEWGPSDDQNISYVGERVKWMTIDVLGAAVGSDDLRRMSIDVGSGSIKCFIGDVIQRGEGIGQRRGGYMRGSSQHSLKQHLANNAGRFTTKFLVEYRAL